MKHAYCIIAHTDEYCLRKLIECIDDLRNDIFLLIDKKSDLFGINLFTSNSKIYIISKEESVDIRWGAYSQIEAELKILKYANKIGIYQYYHLISGQDLPIKSQDYIHSYFEKLPVGTNLIGFKDNRFIDKINTYKRVVPYHLFRNNLRHKNPLIRLFCRTTEEISSQIQRMLKLIINKNIDYRKGCNWVSITNEFVEYLIANEQYTKDILGKAIICDELFMQTMIWNSKFRNSVYDYGDEYSGCMREIDWTRGRPYVWKIQDYNYLINSNKLFARKFSSSVDTEIINSICNHVQIK